MGVLKGHRRQESYGWERRGDRVKACVPVVCLERRPSLDPRVWQGVNPAIFPLSTTTCENIASLEGTSPSDTLAGFYRYFSVYWVQKFC